jgi:hypothetical protein
MHNSTKRGKRRKLEDISERKKLIAEVNGVFRCHKTEKVSC